MNAVDRIVQQARAKIREHADLAAQHVDFIAYYFDTGNPDRRLLLATMPDEDNEIFQQLVRAGIDAQIAQRTLETWGEVA